MNAPNAEAERSDRRLTGLDSAFLAVETPAAHMHVTAVATLAPADGQPASFDRIRAHLAPRLRALPIFRRSLREVPLGLDHPVWFEQDFDLDAHLHRAALPSPGTLAELETLVGHLAGLPLDRTRPLWDLWVVEGLGGDRVALVAKVHHALIDGVAGMEVFGRLLDADRDAPARTGPERGSRASSRPPAPAALLRRAVKSLVRRPYQVARHSLGSASRVARRIWEVAARPGRDPVLPASLPAPDTALNGAISARRQVMFGSLPLDEVQALKRAFGVKLNDVVLGLCAGTLRRYLSDRGTPPESPLVTAIPVSTATAPTSRNGGKEEGRNGGNQVSALTVELPVHLADPVARIANIHRGMLRAKRAHRAIGGDLLAGWAEITPPILLSGLTQLYSRLDLADRHRPAVNLVVSNVPGPRFGLYCAGHRVEACHPLGPIYEGCALNLTVMSYDGRLHFGWVTCPDVVSDLDRIGEALAEAMTELRGVADPGDRRRGGALSRTEPGLVDPVGLELPL